MIFKSWLNTPILVKVFFPHIILHVILFDLLYLGSIPTHASQFLDDKSSQDFLILLRIFPSTQNRP